MKTKEKILAKVAGVKVITVMRFKESYVTVSEALQAMEEYAEIKVKEFAENSKRQDENTDVNEQASK